MIILSLLMSASFISCVKGFESFDIRKIKALTSERDGSGMDKPSGFSSFFGLNTGGAYTLQICREPGDCCRTNALNSEDNNWELGQVDWFVGKQIHGCYGFDIRDPTSVTVQLFHKGRNSGRLEYIRLYTWHAQSYFLCPINIRLEGTSFITSCQYMEANGDQGQAEWCNGSKEFCPLKINQFLFPGTHNTGTGQKEGTIRCASKNQDLSITEQLDFGIRFFDLDTIFSYGLAGCDGLETGHGSLPELGIYQCYGKLADLLEDVKDWIEAHPREVIILYFGNIEFKATTTPELVKTIKSTFKNTTGVRLNTDYKETGDWPTLQQAINESANIFVFIRDPRVAGEQDMIESMKVKPAGVVAQKPLSAVTILTSYSAKSVGSDCGYVLNATAESCARTDVDFIKLSLFSAYFKTGGDCLWHTARICNKQTDNAIQLCSRIYETSLVDPEKNGRFAPNFLLLDYPNYQGTDAKNLVELCREENLRRANMMKEALAAQNQIQE